VQYTRRLKIIKHTNARSQKEKGEIK